MASTKNDKQVMDVSKPGKSAPDSSAKPVIVGHKPQVQDPMVTNETNPEAKNPETEATEMEIGSPSSSKKVITPIEEVQEGSDTTTTVEKSEAEVEGEKAEEPAAPAEESTPAPTTESTEAAVVDAVVDQVADKNKAQAISEEERKKQEEIEKLVAEKKFFVPLGKSHGRSSKILFVITGLLLIIFIGLILAIDAEIIDAGFTLPFNFL